MRNSNVTETMPKNDLNKLENCVSGRGGFRIFERYNTIQYNTIQYNTIFVLLQINITDDGSCLNPIEIELSAINGQNMSNVYSYI